jgi:hypothetical protein
MSKSSVKSRRRHGNSSKKFRIKRRIAKNALLCRKGTLLEEDLQPLSLKDPPEGFFKLSSRIRKQE